MYIFLPHRKLDMFCQNLVSISKFFFLQLLVEMDLRNILWYCNMEEKNFHFLLTLGLGISEVPGCHLLR